MIQSFSLFVFSSIVGVFSSAAIKIIFYHYIVLTTIRLATSQRMFSRYGSNDRFETNLRLAVQTNKKILFFWYPLLFVTGFCNVLLLIIFIDPNSQHYFVPFYLKIISIIGTATVIVYALMTPVTRSPLFVWKIDLQIFSIDFDIKQLTNAIDDVSSNPLLSDHNRQHLIDDLSLRIDHLIKKKNSLLYIKQHINKL